MYENKSYPITVKRTELVDGQYSTNEYNFDISTKFFFNRNENKLFIVNNVAFVIVIVLEMLDVYITV